MSTNLEPHAVGGQFDLLVCEIVDNQLLGEGVLTTIADARRRLLTPGATIIPSGAKVFATPVEMRVSTRCGFALDDLNLFATDHSLAPRGHTGCKLQRKPPGSFHVLTDGGGPIELFDFDFARGDLAALAKGRVREDIHMRIGRSGVCSAFLIHFSLRCDADPANHFDSGPTNAELVAWDQNQRNLPIEVRVRAGQAVKLHVSHDHEAVRVGLPSLLPEMVADAVGHTEILPPPLGPKR
jgi:protein arginine N-methyltransferase 7